MTVYIKKNEEDPYVKFDGDYKKLLNIKIYIAAMYSLKEEVKKLARVLEKGGFTVVSTWHTEDYSPNQKVQDLTSEIIEPIALRDIKEVQSCDVMIFFAEHPDTPTVRGGRHVEFGMALAYEKKIIVLGEKENIFHYIYPQVMHTDLNSLLERLIGY